MASQKGGSSPVKLEDAEVVTQILMIGNVRYDVKQRVAVLTELVKRGDIQISHLKDIIGNTYYSPVHYEALQLLRELQENENDDGA